MRDTAMTLIRFGSAAVIATAWIGGGTACSIESRIQPAEPDARAAAGQPSSDEINADQNQLLATIRQATARYHRVDAAIADGYVQGSPCESMPGQGIGIHYRKASLFDAVVDPSQPELLVYEPKSNGNLELVSVAFVVPAAAWDPSHSSPPMLGTQVLLDKRIPDWSSPPFPNYEVHVWVWKENPNGMYATTNPKVSCEDA
jgi:hypothetical protein